MKHNAAARSSAPIKASRISMPDDASNTENNTHLNRIYSEIIQKFSIDEQAEIRRIFPVDNVADKYTDNSNDHKDDKALRRYIKERMTFALVNVRTRRRNR